MVDAVVSIEGPRMSEGSARADALPQLVRAQGTAPPPHASAAGFSMAVTSATDMKWRTS